jgi:hypothetical protein
MLMFRYKRRKFEHDERFGERMERLCGGKDVLRVGLSWLVECGGHLIRPRPKSGLKGAEMLEGT